MPPEGDVNAKTCQSAAAWGGPRADPQVARLVGRTEGRQVTESTRSRPELASSPLARGPHDRLVASPDFLRFSAERLPPLCEGERIATAVNQIGSTVSALNGLDTTPSIIIFKSIW